MEIALRLPSCMHLTTCSARSCSVSEAGSAMLQTFKTASNPGAGRAALWALSASCLAIRSGSSDSSRSCTAKDDPG